MEAAGSTPRADECAVHDFYRGWIDGGIFRLNMSQQSTQFGIQHHFASGLSLFCFQNDCFSTSVVQVLHINCSGAIFQLPKRGLCFIEGPVIS